MFLVGCTSTRMRCHSQNHGNHSAISPANQFPLCIYRKLTKAKWFGLTLNFNHKLCKFTEGNAHFHHSLLSYHIVTMRMLHLLSVLLTHISHYVESAPFPSTIFYTKFDGPFASFSIYPSLVQIVESATYSLSLSLSLCVRLFFSAGSLFCLYHKNPPYSSSSTQKQCK